MNDSRNIPNKTTAPASSLESTISLVQDTYVSPEKEMRVLKLPEPTKKEREPSEPRRVTFKDPNSQRSGVK
jgi:hypothetical protein